MPKPSLTFPTGLVLYAISNGIRYGFEIIDATGLPSGTVYYGAGGQYTLHPCTDGRWCDRQRP